jgi:hypothetical protein
MYGRGNVQVCSPEELPDTLVLPLAQQNRGNNYGSEYTTWLQGI